MKPIVKVVCGIVRKDSKILIARRKPGKSMGGYWEFPGGKLNESEDPIMGLERELLEELGMRVSNVNYFGRHEHEYENFIIDLIAYQGDFIEATFQMTDHDIFEFATKEKLIDYTFAPADIPFVSLLLK